MRVAIADDSMLFRAGLASLLTTNGAEVIAMSRTGDDLEEMIADAPPDVAILDIRMPPTFTDEGVASALRLRARHCRIGVLVLSTYAQPDYAVRLLEPGSAGMGYLLKDRVDDLNTLRDALDRLAAGESVVDPTIVEELLQRRRVRDSVEQLSQREREVLKFMAEGRSNAGIGAKLYLSQKTVETHAAAVFTKLGLYQSSADNRRVLAVLAFLQSNSGRRQL